MLTETFTSIFIFMAKIKSLTNRLATRWLSDVSWNHTNMTTYIITSKFHQCPPIHSLDQHVSHLQR